MRTSGGVTPRSRCAAWLAGAFGVLALAGCGSEGDGPARAFPPPPPPGAAVAPAPPAPKAPPGKIQVLDEDTSHHLRRKARRSQ
jgi:hypothetical protein